MEERDIFSYLQTIEIKSITDKYKATPDQVLLLFKQAYNSDLELQKVIRQYKDIKAVIRTRPYKNFIKKLKKSLYYDLRQYKGDSEVINNIVEQIKVEVDKNKIEALFVELLQTHVSTKERWPYKDDFNKFLQTYINRQTTVLDLGCGLDPIMWYELNAKQIVAMDRDITVTDILKLYQSKLRLKNLHVVTGDLQDFKVADHLSTGTNQFGLVMMLKLIPVVARQQRKLLSVLAKMPAEKMLITASKQALAKKQDISKREDKVLQEFIALTGKTVEACLDLPNEFGYIIT